MIIPRQGPEEGDLFPGTGKGSGTATAEAGIVSGPLSSVTEARALCSAFAQTSIRIQLSFGDLLQGEVGQRHRGVLLRLAKTLWPRRLIRTCCKRNGHLLLIEAVK